MELWVLRGHRWCPAAHKSPGKLHAMFNFSLSVHMSIFLGKGSIAFIRFSKIQNPESVKKKKKKESCSSFKILPNLRPCSLIKSC